MAPSTPAVTNSAARSRPTAMSFERRRIRWPRRIGTIAAMRITQSRPAVNPARQRRAGRVRWNSDAGKPIAQGLHPRKGSNMARSGRTNRILRAAGLGLCLAAPAWAQSPDDALKQNRDRQAVAAQKAENDVVQAIV